MIVGRLELVDFRNYRSRHVSTLEPGTTAVLGDNGQGKTNLAEALAYLATLDSFRGAPPDALIRGGAETAVDPGRGRATTTGVELLIEAEISRERAATGCWSTGSGWPAAATCSA